MNINIQIVTTDNLSDLLTKKLVEEGHNIVSKTNSYSEAFNQYRNYLPDLIFVDLDILDVSSGIKFCRGIYNIDTNAQIIVLSENLNTLIKSELFEIGVEHWIDKPFQIINIFSAINSICSNYDLLKLRSTRKILDFNEFKNTISQKDQNYSNINSLREQIRLNRELSEKPAESNQDTFLNFDEQPAFDFTLDTYDEEFFNLDLEDDCTPSKPDRNLHAENLNVSRHNHLDQVTIKTKGNKTYLGLPKFININDLDKDTNKTSFDSNQNISKENQAPQNNTQEKKEPLLGFIKRLRK